jgi:hypothetical protein
MRMVAGITLAFLGMVEVVIGLYPFLGIPWLHSYFYTVWETTYWALIRAALFVTGGVFCFKGKSWELCMSSGLLALAAGIYELVLSQTFTIEGLTLAYGIVAFGGLVSTLFVSFTRKEWQEVQG